MKVYEPNAVALDGNGKPTRLFTQNGCVKLSDCTKVIDSWYDNWTLHTSWVVKRTDDGRTETLHLRTYRENFL